MEFREDILLNYMSMAPLALAFERFMECSIYRQLDFKRPILDLGCGDGLLSHILFSEPIDTGIDSNPLELERARQHGSYTELIACPGSDIPKPSGSYQTIFSNSVLEHSFEFEPIFKEVHRLLAFGGRFYLTVPTPLFEQYTMVNTLLKACFLHGLAGRYRRLCSTMIWRQYHYHTCEEWCAIAREYGFTIVDAFPYDSRAICLLNNFLYPFAGMSLISKRLIHRWVLFPHLRKTIMKPLSPLMKRILNKSTGITKADLSSLRSRKDRLHEQSHGNSPYL